MSESKNKPRPRPRGKGGDIYKVMDVHHREPEFYDLLDFQIQQLLTEVDRDNDVVNTEEIRGILNAIRYLLDDVDEAMTAKK